MLWQLCVLMRRARERERGGCKYAGMHAVGGKKRKEKEEGGGEREREETGIPDTRGNRGVRGEVR